MKSLSHTRRGIAALAASALLVGMPAALPAQQASQPPQAAIPQAPPPQGTQPPQSIVSQPVGAVVSARAGQRTALPMPPPQADGIHLSLDEAIRVALANNQDLNVTVNSAEASQFFLFQQTDSSSAQAQVSQLTPWGSIFSLGFNADRTKTNSSFQTINPAYGSGLVLG